MHVGKLVFAQLMEHLPWRSFGRIVERYGGDRRVCHFSGAPVSSDVSPWNFLMRAFVGVGLAIFAAWVGIEAIATRDTWLWGSVSSSAGSAGLTADYPVRGVLAVVIGVGWLFAALAAVTGLAAPQRLRASGLGYTITGIALIIFAICFVYVAAKSVLQTYVPGWA